MEIEATYSKGVLVPDQPLPLKEDERVRISVKPKVSRARQSAGLIKWTGDPKDLERIAEDPEFGIHECP